MLLRGGRGEGMGGILTLQHLHPSLPSLTSFISFSFLLPSLSLSFSLPFHVSSLHLLLSPFTLLLSSLYHLSYFSYSSSSSSSSRTRSPKFHNQEEATCSRGVAARSLNSPLLQRVARADVDDVVAAEAQNPKERIAGSWVLRQLGECEVQEAGGGQLGITFDPAHPRHLLPVEVVNL